jgi:hypothetical protein
MGIGKSSGWVNTLMDKLTELKEELLSVLSGSGGRILDSILPTGIFLVLNPFLNIIPALSISLGVAILIFLIRIIRKDNQYYALGGVGAALFAGIFALVSDSALGFFLPSLISSGLLVFLLLISALIKRPLAAVTSHLTRGWPLDWYWQKRVLPAYNEVTLFWAAGFGARLALEYWLYQQGAAGRLGLVQTILGWPYTILILILSYLYGIWRLQGLGGPSVEEFRAGNEPPWEGQKRGF